MATNIWDVWNEGGGPKYPHEKVIQFCFRNYPPDQRKNVRALDLGCGSGVHTVFLATEGFQVTGIDISKVGIENTRRKLNALGLKALLRVDSADVLDFPCESFDLVICIGVYDCTGPAVAKASVQRLADVLASGGRGLFVFASDRDFRANGEKFCPLYGYTRSRMSKIFAQGFAKIWIDRYITTYQGGQIEQNDWLIKLKK